MTTCHSQGSTNTQTTRQKYRPDAYHSQEGEEKNLPEVWYTISLEVCATSSQRIPFEPFKASVCWKISFTFAIHCPPTTTIFRQLSGMVKVLLPLIMAALLLQTRHNPASPDNQTVYLGDAVDWAHTTSWPGTGCFACGKVWLASCIGLHTNLHNQSILLLTASTCH